MQSGLGLLTVGLAVTGWLVVAGHSFHNVSDPHWHTATATWYGDPNGDGSDGGACGYGTLVDVRPLKARVGAVSPILFKDGEGCGACFKVMCLDHTICAKRAVTVIVMDRSPVVGRSPVHFDLSGAAFGHMAVRGQNTKLRNRGILNILYRSFVTKLYRELRYEAHLQNFITIRCTQGFVMKLLIQFRHEAGTECKYKGKNVAFHVNAGSTDYYLSLLIEYEDGDGDIGSMHIRPSGSSEWLEMTHLWGANWCINGGPLKGPFSVKLRSLSLGNTLAARDVIPSHWSPKATYTSRLNFAP